MSARGSGSAATTAPASSRGGPALAAAPAAALKKPTQHPRGAADEGPPTDGFTHARGALAAPVILYGHRHPPCAVTFQLDGPGEGGDSAQLDAGNVTDGRDPIQTGRAHVVSVDESGRAIVWGLRR